MDILIEDLMNYFEEANANKYNYHIIKSDVKRILEPYIEEVKGNAYTDGYDAGLVGGYDAGYEVAIEELVERNEI